MFKCSGCSEKITDGEPRLKYRNLILCSGCYINLIPEIFGMRSAGDGGLIDLLFTECVKLDYNLTYKKKPVPISKLGERIEKVFKPKK